MCKLFNFRREADAILMLERLCAASADIALLNSLMAHALARFPESNILSTAWSALYSGPVYMGNVSFDRDMEIQILRHTDARKAIVCFSGMQGRCLGLNWSIFFRSIAFRCNADLIIFRDKTNSCFINGTSDERDFSHLINSITEVVERSCYQEVTVLGCSMGSYGALLVAGVLELPRVVCLAGPTSLALGASDYWKGKKPFYTALIQRIGAARIADTDPLAILRGKYSTRIDYFYGCLNEFDALCADHLKKNLLDCVSLHPYPTSDHAITRWCIDDKALQAFLAA